MGIIQDMYGSLLVFYQEKREDTNMAKMYLIGNSHLDPVWLWRWREGFSEVLATYRSALDRMHDFPDFKFTSACAAYYEWVEKCDPQMFEEIRQRVKEGRWNIVGGWYLQPDCNMPCGESFARHSLISQRYFQEKFGTIAKTGYNVDSFGHNGNLPKILRSSGMENYVYQRPSLGEKDLEDKLFYWESDDESQVLACRLPFGYFTHAGEGGVGNFLKIEEMMEKDQRDTMAFFGVGNHGGGPTIQLIHDINALGLKDTVYSTPDEYFQNVSRDGLRVIHDDLQHHAIGCYTACTYVKKANRAAENALLRTETLSVMAKKLAGYQYPEKRMKKAWKNVLFNQFHDILAGCSIKKAYEDAGYLYGEAMSVVEQNSYFAMLAISRKINTLQGQTLPAYKNNTNWKYWSHEVLGTPIVVFNPYTWPVKMPVVLNTIAKKMTDVDGKEIPFQIVRGDQTNQDWDRYHTVFVAEVPALGYTVYRSFQEQESAVTFDNPIKSGERTLENDKLILKLDEKTGDICYLYAKDKEQVLIDKACRAVLVDETDCDTWAHFKNSIGPDAGEFGTPEFILIEEGPVRATLRAVTRYGNSVLQRDYILSAGSDEVKVQVKVDFQEKHRMLKFTFPMTDGRVTAQIPFGTIEREANGNEEPMGHWFASGSLCVTNDSKHGYDTDVEKQEVRMSVLRSAIWADHMGVRDEHCEYMDLGVTEFCYSLSPYVNAADAERRSRAFQEPLPFVAESFHEGPLPETMSCFACDCQDVVVSAVKQSEDAASDILRLCEWNGNAVHTSYQLFGQEVQVEMKAHQVKTYNTDGKELNLLEWEVSC